MLRRKTANERFTPADSDQEMNEWTPNRRRAPGELQFVWRSQRPTPPQGLGGRWSPPAAHAEHECPPSAPPPFSNAMFRVTEAEKCWWIKDLEEKNTFLFICSTHKEIYLSFRWELVGGYNVVKFISVHFFIHFFSTWSFSLIILL